MKYKIIFIGSTGGGLLARLLEHEFVRDMTFEVVADRSCGFIEVGRRHRVATAIFPTKSGLDFANWLNERYAQQQNLLFVSFYTRILKGQFLITFAGKIFNCHPSLLPSFPGQQGFQKTMNSSALFMGCTLHLIDQGMDTGACVIQMAYPLNRHLPTEMNRVKLFLGQYYTTLQFLKWIQDDRLQLVGQSAVTIKNAKYAASPFSPNLDEDLFSFLNFSNELDAN